MSSISTKSLNQSLTSKTLIIFYLIISIVTLSCFIIYDKKSLPTIYFSISSLISSSSSSQINLNQCYLSIKESDGWFCELDSDWKRRKSLHHIQYKRNRVSDERSMFFQNNWEPTIQCEFERRLGRIGDGGNGFERGIKEQLSGAEIHTFDMGLYQCPDDICKFHQARLGNGKNDSSKSLQTIINELDHQKRQIHILKVDIEGSEFNLFEELFKSSINNQTNVPYIRQILFEIHLDNNKTEESCRRTHQLFELFRLNNYAIFHKETNLYDARNVFEYALLRLNPVFFIS